jgi:hypothetical protein
MGGQTWAAKARAAHPQHAADEGQRVVRVRHLAQQGARRRRLPVADLVHERDGGHVGPRAPPGGKGEGRGRGEGEWAGAGSRDPGRRGAWGSAGAGLAAGPPARRPGPRRTWSPAAPRGRAPRAPARPRGATRGRWAPPGSCTAPRRRGGPPTRRAARAASGPKGEREARRGGGAAVRMRTRAKTAAAPHCRFADRSKPPLPPVPRRCLPPPPPPPPPRPPPGGGGAPRGRGRGAGAPPPPPPARHLERDARGKAVACRGAQLQPRAPRGVGRDGRALEQRGAGAMRGQQDRGVGGRRGAGAAAEAIDAVVWGRGRRVWARGRKARARRRRGRPPAAGPPPQPQPAAPHPTPGPHLTRSTLSSPCSSSAASDSPRPGDSFTAASEFCKPCTCGGGGGPRQRPAGGSGGGAPSAGAARPAAASAAASAAAGRASC